MTESAPDDGLALPPRMLGRPADPPAALARVSHSGPVQKFQRELSAQRQMRRSPRLGSFRASARAWVGRVSGRADRRLLFAVAETIDALIAHCDALTDHVTNQEELTADVVASFGEDLTRLRAEVIHLGRLTAKLEEDGGG
jgi:hypothetical protein